MHPETAPYDQGLLDVGDGNLVRWEVSGNPEGKPALVVHGGPGSGSSSRSRRFFDPEAYRVVLFDQRGCGRSVPHASDPAADLSVNTTAHLVADMERLREHLGIEKWLLHGGSWGSTLILAYAEAHPERVTEIVIAAVTTTRRSETAWLYEGVGRFFPEAHERFRAGAGTADGAGAEELVGAYAALMNHPDRAVREKAAADWCAWEDAVLSMEGMGTPYTDRVDDTRLGFVRICSHYFAHGTWAARRPVAWSSRPSTASRGTEPGKDGESRPVVRELRIPDFNPARPGRNCGESVHRTPPRSLTSPQPRPYREGLL
ncbi:alpha/beta fold hydrolase [Streptomyces sp. NPDC088752]|uniref:alpha/beta fold hydrolase n=1 Tax=Streptomyces sp. NPDC088752 TaxID=3154963 RepID=UPI00342AA2B3